MRNALMGPNYLGQVLILQTQISFVTIAATLAELGFTREDKSSTTPLISGEPEMASWSINGGKPFIIYTFNPVVSMRVLDVATVPPGLRMAIASQLPIIDEQLISCYFESDNVRERLLALWAAQETERVDLIQSVAALEQDKEPVIAEQAQEIGVRLQQMNQAREQMLVQLKLLAESAPELIMQMHDPKFIVKLKPQKDDLAKLFDENLVNALAQCVDTIYQQQPVFNTLSADSEIDVVAAPAGLLRWPNMLSEKFPGGYRDIAGWMTPGKIWLTWQIKDKTTSVRYDGLVWLDNKWVWLPKIYRLLTPYLMASTQAAVQRH